MQIEQLREILFIYSRRHSNYWYNSHMKYNRLLSNIFNIVGAPIITFYKCIPSFKEINFFTPCLLYTSDAADE